MTVKTEPAPISWWKAEGNALDSVGNNSSSFPILEYDVLQKLPLTISLGLLDEESLQDI